MKINQEIKYLEFPGPIYKLKYVVMNIMET